MKDDHARKGAPTRALERMRLGKRGNQTRTGKRVARALLAACLVLGAVPAFAYISVPRVGGLNGTGPTAEMVTSIYANPAAIGRLTGSHFFFDANGTYLVARFTRDGIDPATRGKYGEVGTAYLSPIPFVGFTTDFGRNDLTWGAAAYAPFGRNALWPKDGTQRYELTTLDIKGYTLTSALSYRFGHNLMLGGGVSLVYFTLDTARSYDLAPSFYTLSEEFLHYSFPQGTVPYQSSLWEARIRARQGGFSWGWNVGLLISPVDWLDLGASYTSHVPLALRGTFTLDLPTTPFALFGLVQLPWGVKSLLEMIAGIRTPDRVKGTTVMRLTLPQNVAAGATFHASRRVDVDLSARWTDWAEYKDLAVTFHSENSQLELPKDRIPLRNVPAWEFAGLLRVRPIEILTVGLGALYETDLIPERWSSAYNVNAPKIDAMAYFDWKVAPKVAWGLGYSHVFFFDKDVDHSAVGVTGSALGRYQVSVDRLGAHVDVAW